MWIAQARLNTISARRPTCSLISVSMTRSEHMYRSISTSGSSNRTLLSARAQGNEDAAIARGRAALLDGALARARGRHRAHRQRQCASAVGSAKGHGLWLGAAALYHRSRGVILPPLPESRRDQRGEIHAGRSGQPELDSLIAPLRPGKPAHHPRYRAAEGLGEAQRPVSIRQGPD